MSQEFNGLPSWLVVVLGALPTAGVLAWHRFFTERTDRRKDTITELRDRVRSTMDAQSLAMYDRLEVENKRLTVRLADVEGDRNRGWDLVRWWNSEAHRIKHLVANLVMIANGRLEKLGMIFAEAEERGWQLTPQQIADIKRVCRPVDIPSLAQPEIEEPIPRHLYHHVPTYPYDGTDD